MGCGWGLKTRGSICREQSDGGPSCRGRTDDLSRIDSCEAEKLALLQKGDERSGEGDPSSKILSGGEKVLLG